MSTLAYINAAVLLANTLAQAATTLATTLATIKTMQAEGRDPTDAEWAELNAVSEGLRTTLHEE